jgi:hypothetical protein
MFEFIILFLIISGFIIGFGAVNVIDMHGFLARKSNYWTLATTRTHKVTKPMIWLGISLVLIGGIFLYKDLFLIIHLSLVSVLIMNGLFLSFVVSPFLLKREREGTESEILPSKIQNKIFISFIFSDLGWWASVVLLVLFLV